MSGHYSTTIPDDCTCRWYTVRIPGEPQIPAMLEAEPDPNCPAHPMGGAS
ncbi:hypothetical protein GS676_02655 [Rhodococcus hoagii]|nr:hypothetical protein [Prescottella equi]